MSDGTARAANAATSTDVAELARLAGADPDTRVRAVALAALVKHASRDVSAPVWRERVSDDDASVRLRAAQIAPHLGRAANNACLLVLLADDNAWVAEAAAYAIGEHPRPTRAAIDALVNATMSHPDSLVREAAVAALGALGDPSTLSAVLHACDDKPAIRRRAVLALASFDGPEVEARLHAALEDHDWQVRQAAADLLHFTP
jgi:HEAT repeat protein